MKRYQLIYIILVIISLTGYFPLSAKNPKKYADTVVLKNGVVLNGIRATDSIVVTTEDGATTIYRKKDISEVKKAGTSREIKENKEPSDNLKSENPTEKKKIKKERAVIDKWSGYLGYMRWDEANIECKKKGMRLPTIGELREAFIDGTTETWKKDGLFYWSSTPGQGDHSYNIGISNGHFFVDDRIFINDVRCIR